MKDEKATTHELKTWTEYFEAIRLGLKAFELRKNDRDYKSGETLILKEYDHKKEEFTGREITAIAGYILEGGQFGLDEGFVIIQLEFANQSNQQSEVERMTPENHVGVLTKAIEAKTVEERALKVMELIMSEEYRKLDTYHKQHQAIIQVIKGATDNGLREFVEEIAETPHTNASRELMQDFINQAREALKQ